MAALQDGRLEEADRQFRRLQRKDRDNVRLMHLLGVIALQRNRPTEAIAQFERAVAHAPAEAGFRGLLGNAYRAGGRPAAAAEAYRAVLGIDPGSVPALLNLGNLSLEQGQEDEAESFYRRAERLQPGNPDVQNGLGQLALQRLPAMADLTAGDRRGAGHQGLLDAAAGHFAAALRAAPDHAAALAGEGHVAAAQGALDRAIAAYDRALQVAPQQPEVAVSLGKAALRSGRIERAEAALEHALQVLPPWPAAQRERQYAHCYRALAAAAAGDDALYADLADPRRLATITELVPAQEGDLNTRLAEVLQHQVPLTWEPRQTTTSAGLQSGDLSGADLPALAAFRARLVAAIDGTIARLPVRAGHPFLGYRPRRYRINLWATVLRDGGHQRPHIHPRGWMSGVYYVQVPPLAPDVAPAAGRLELGRPEELLPLPPAPLLREVAAEPGRLVLFPSYLFHRTIPFHGRDAQPRISLAFDVVPEA